MKETIGTKFWELTRYSHLSTPPQKDGQPQPALELAYDPTASLIHLPEPSEIQTSDPGLWQVINQRVTLRGYTQQSLSLTELSLLLWASQGVKEITNRPATLRTVPSAGARHAFETFLLINRVEGLKSGLYRFIATEHALLALDSPADITETFMNACLKQRQIPGSAVTFIWVAVAERMFWRYVERGYRYLLLDAGHVCQNLYLASEAIGCGACAIAAFDDDLVNQALNLDGKDLFAVYLASVGKRDSKDS